MSDYNKVRDIRIGLEIFERHGGEYASAEHDIFYAGQKDREALSAEEIKALVDAGWHRQSEFCDCENAAIVDGEDNGQHEPTCNQWGIFT